MPLPPALLKRLASRGIVNSGSQASNQQQQQQNTENEEIIAEDYDDIEDPSQYDIETHPVKKLQENFWIERMKRRITDSSSGYKSCPNKCNIFHKCTLYCINRWGDGILEPSAEYMKRYNRLLKKYPLPKNWVEIYDHGCGVYYFWNTSDDTVSWLPPNHPESQISKCAAILRRELEESQPQGDEDQENENDEQSVSSASKRPISPPPLNSTTAFPVLKKPKARDLDKALRQKTARKSNKSNSNDQPLDPMDPAAYSDIPRGKWSDGLNTESKTGVDSTASGALFQMRPYPSPGAILQSNAVSSSKNPKSSKDNNDSDEDSN